MAINDQVIKMSEVIQKGIKADKDLGTLSGDSVYEQTLPLSDLTMETVRKVQDHNSTFVAASTHAFGAMALDMMKENSKLDIVSGGWNMGADSLDLQIQRQREMQVPGKDEKITKYGVSVITHQVNASRNTGELRKVRNEINELALAAFKQ